MTGLASVLLLGIGAQWLAWRLRLPSILLLLLVGFVVGPLTGWLDPDALLGDALLPIVSISVAIILLEGGLSLRFSDLRGVGAAVRNLVVIGIPVTWVLAAAAAYYVLEFDLRLAVLLGAVLVVTGPTVIIPLLRHVRPSASIASVVRWEGIVNDALGAILAVLVYQVMLVPDAGEAGKEAAIGGLRALVVGSAAGGVAALVLLIVMARHRLPDFLHNPVALAIGLLAFVVSDHAQHESGLLAVTVMGVILANQQRVSIEHIVEFKENLRVLLISSLFILLAARIPAELLWLDLRDLLFVAALVIVVRPISVFLSTVGTGIGWREKLFVAWMAPRGIVAAAICSVFALDLTAAGYVGAERLAQVGFAVIVGTVAIYGLTAGPLARWLGISRGTPQGLLFVGAGKWVRALARVLRDEGVDVLLVDRNHAAARAARMSGLAIRRDDVLRDSFLERAPLEGVGKVLCMTRNDEVNSLACLRLTEIVGRSEIYQLPSAESATKGADERLPQHLRGRILFGPSWSHEQLTRRVAEGATFKCTRLSEEFDYDDFCAIHEGDGRPVVPLMTISEEGDIRIRTTEDAGDPAPTGRLVALVPAPGGADESSPAGS
jgi:NhaP-type Na+/H+ or K+/H+ antiporter